MMIKIRKTTEVADKLLAVIRKFEGPAVYAVPYLNGREKGWTLFPEAGVQYDSAAGVTFSEFRSSDEIVLYTGTNPHIHADNAQPITEKIGRAAQFFPRGEYRKAALAAVEFLKSATPATVGGRK